MRKEQLLEAVGNVDEQLLVQAEKTVNRHRVVGRFALIAAIVAALAITAGASAGLFSRPIKEHKLLEDETVAPFDMDADGNILPGGVKGLTVTMEVAFDNDAPAWIEEFYRLDPGDPWQYAGGGGAGDGYEFGFMRTDWQIEGKPGRLRLHQSVASYYTQSGNGSVGTLEELTPNDGVSAETVEMAGAQMLKVTIPALKDYDGIQYCADGETRLYWTDGKYILELDYPSWVTDQKAEKLLESLYLEPYTPAYPKNYGKIDTGVIENMKPGFSVTAGDTGTTAANSSMGLGLFAYSEGSVYMGESGRIQRYDLQSGQTKTYVLSDAYSSPKLLFCTEAYVCYVDAWNCLVAVNKETGAEQVLYEGIYSGDLYADGPKLYTRRGVMDLQTGQIRQYAEEINSCYVDDAYVYATPTDDGYYFLRRAKDVESFERIELDFFPIKVLANGEDLYFSEGGASKSYQLIHYRDGVQTRLPIHTLQYQILDGQIIYLDRDGKNLNRYDPATGETTRIGTNVFDFSILEGRYICMDLYNEAPVILDWETGKRVTIE